MSLEKLLALFKPYQDKRPERHLPARRLPLAQYQQVIDHRQAVAQEMAHQIYKLVSVERVIEPMAYVNTVEAAVLTSHSEENQYILQFSQEYFEEHYFEAIKKRGESPKMIDQIVRRLGKDNKLQIERALNGFDVNRLAEELYSLDYENSPDKVDLLYQEISKLPDHHLEELVAEFDIMPGREIADFMFKCLTETSPDLATLKLLLQTNPPEEIEKIIELFEEAYVLQEGEEPLDFAAWLEGRYSGDIVQVIRQVMLGLDFEDLAKQVAWIFYNLDALWIDFASLQSSIWGLVMHVRHHVEDGFSPELELLARPFVLSLVSHLDAEQFDSLSVVLQEKYQIQLSKNLYDLDWHDTALETFFKLEKSISMLAQQDKHKSFVTLFYYQYCVARLNHEIHIIPELPYYSQVLASLYPLYSLVPDQLEELTDNFKIITGEDLINVLTKKINYFLREECPHYLEDLLALLVSGLQHKSAFQNIHSFLVHQADRIKQHTPSRRLEKVSEQIYNLCNDLSLRPAERSQFLFAQLQLLNKQELGELVHHYHVRYEQNLISRIVPLITPASEVKLKILLSGFNPTIKFQEMLENYDWLDYVHCSPLEIAILDKELQASQQKTLIEWLEERFTDPDELKKQLIPAYFPLVSQFKTRLLDAEDWNEMDTDNFIKTFQGHNTQMHAMEQAYDLLFGTWEFGLELSQGAWRNSLLVQVNQQVLTPPNYSNIISVQEKIPIELIPQFYALAKESDLGHEILLQLNDLFRQYVNDLKIIKMLYLVYDGEHSMRERIYRFQVLPRDESLGLLLLDGYDPEKLARDLAELVKSKSHIQLAKELLSIFDNTSSKVIPSKTNWRGEMYHQLRLRYQEHTDSSFISDLLSREVPKEGEESVKVICDYLYGEVAAKAHAVHKLFTTQPPDVIEETLAKVVFMHKPAEVERLAHMYESYYGITLAEEIKNRLNKSAIQGFLKKLEKARTWEQDKLKEKIEGSEA